MLKFSFILALFTSAFSAHAIYLTSGQPAGELVDLKTTEIKLNFSQDLIKLGEKQVKEEQLAKLKTDNLNCSWRYEGLRTLVCKTKEPLNPGTNYRIRILQGFQGLDLNDKFDYEAGHQFKTDTLSIVDYQVLWDKHVPIIGITFNMKVKGDNRSGVIQCPNRELGVTFEPLKDKKGESTFRVKGAGEIKPDESCVFYFNRPLSYRDFPGSSIPAQRAFLDHSITSLHHNPGSFEYQAGCRNNYRVSVKLFGPTLPYLRCEFNDSVNLGIYVDSKLKPEEFIQVIPKDNVKITNNDGNIVISNFAGPKKNYVIKISRKFPLPRAYDPYGNQLKALLNRLTQDVYLQLETMDNPPLLAPVKNLGVIEKDGPWQVGYSALNIKDYFLYYEFKDDVDDLSDLSNLIPSKESFEHKKTFTLSAPDNVNRLLPINVKDLSKGTDFKAGVFQGKMIVNNVDPKFTEPEMLLVPEANERKDRREFKFGYLFTDIGMHMKRGKKGVLIWTTSLKTGKPLSGVKLKLFATGGVEFSETTDENGLAHFEDYLQKKEDHVSVVARKGDDISFINTYGNWGNGIGRWDFNLGYYYGGHHNLILDIVAERPLYLPGETANLKFFVRKRIPDSVELASVGTTLSYELHDSRDEIVQKGELKLNGYGTGVMQYEIPPKAATGQYRIVVKDGEDNHYQEAFDVYEFRKPEFKVKMAETVDAFEGDITYFKGGPVKNLPGEAVVLFKSTTFPTKDESHNRFQLPEGIGPYYNEYGSYSSVDVLSNQEIQSDDKGHFVLKKAPIMKSVTKYGTVIIEGNFKDENGGNISGRTEARVNPFDLIPGIDFTSWMFETKKPIVAEATAFNDKGEVVNGVKMNLKVVRVDWYYERRLGSGNYFYYDSRKVETDVTNCDFVTNQELKACPVTIEKAGYYEFTVSVMDKKLKALPAKASTYVYAAGEFLGFETTNHDRINLTVENTKLELGKKLKVMAISPLSDGEALVTLERDGVLYREQVPFKGNVLLWEKDITEERFIPGFYVSVVIVKGRVSDKIENQIDLGRPQFKIGYKRVEVSNKEKRLSVKVKPKLKQLEPGQTMEVEAELVDYKGKGVQGELAIAVVDEALLSLAGPYQGNYDVLDTFYSLGALNVENFQTLTQLIGRRTFGKKGANQGGGGGLDVRSNFKNTAYWEAQAETDKNGKHQFKFKVPDNLTTWKVIAIAVDKNHRFGVGENEFLVSKALMLEPALPNFLVNGDKFNAKVTVTNRAGQKQNVVVDASSNFFSIPKKEQSVTVEDDDKVSLFFPMAVEKAKATDVTFRAKGDKASDAFRVTLPVLENSLKHSFVSSGLLQQKQEVPLSIDKSANQDTLMLSVRTSTTVLEGLDEVFRYVLTYPYGCWEQKLTSTYFLAQYEVMKDVLTYRFEENKGSISKAIQGILDLAKDYQSSNGGMKYYPGGYDEGDVYLSTFTAGSFVRLKKLGYKVDAEVEKKLKGYLLALLSTEQNWSAWYARDAKSSTRAYILWVLSEMGGVDLSAYYSRPFSEHKSLDLFGLSFLTSAMTKVPSYAKEAKVLQDRLDSLKETSGARTTFKEPLPPREEWRYWSYTSERSICAALSAQLNYVKDQAELAKIVRSIVGGLKNGHWYNTQENFFCFDALHTYAERFEKERGSPKAKVELDGDEVDAKPLVTKFSSVVNLEGEKVPLKSQKLAFSTSEKEALYYTTILKFETPYKARPAISEGFKLKKSLWLLTPKNNKPAWTELVGTEHNIKRGDIVKVRLSVTVEGPRYQVMLNDTLAGGLEPINTQLATTSLASGELLKSNKTYAWETPYYHGDFEFLDLRLTAAQFYARSLKAGSFEVEYLVQAIATGEFNMPESTVEEMYYPDVRGTDVARKIIVSE